MRQGNPHQETARDPLLVFERRHSTTRHEECQHDCDNYHSVSLLSIVRTLFAQVVLKSLQVLAERVHPKSQCRFRAERSTADMVFSLRQLQENAGNRDSHSTLPLSTAPRPLTLLAEMAFSRSWPRLVALQHWGNFMKSWRGTIVYHGSTLEPFDFCSGVKQGCVLVPTLFGIFFSFLLKHAFGSATKGIYLHTRSSENLFKFSRPKCKQSVSGTFCLQTMCPSLPTARKTYSSSWTALCMLARIFGLTVSLREMQVMGQDVEHPSASQTTSWKLSTSLCTWVEQYLTGSPLRPRSTGTSGKPPLHSPSWHKKWSNSPSTLKSRCTRHAYWAPYFTAVSNGLCAQSKNKTPFSFHLHCLRHILVISLRDKVPNNTVLERAGITVMYTIFR